MNDFNLKTYVSSRIESFHSQFKKLVKGSKFFTKIIN